MVKIPHVFPAVFLGVPETLESSPFNHFIRWEENEKLFA